MNTNQPKMRALVVVTTGLATATSAFVTPSTRLHAMRKAQFPPAEVAEAPLGSLRRIPTLALKTQASATATKTSSVDIPLLLYFFFWYLGNYYYNIANKLALQAAGGASGFPLTISTLQLLVGAIYATFLWLAPDSRPFPKTTPADIVKLLPVAFCAAGAHAGSVFALSAGAVSFGQIVKAAEPAFAAVLGQLLATCV